MTLLLVLPREPMLLSDKARKVISTHEELHGMVSDAADVTTALETKVGAKRGGRRTTARGRGDLMDQKVTIVSGDTGKAVVPHR